MPKPWRSIFRKLLTLPFQVAIDCLRAWFRPRLNLPDGELAAIAGVQSFGDCLERHPHLHVLAAAGLIDRGGRFHGMPVEKRRGSGGVLDAGEAEARRVSPPGEAGESKHRTLGRALPQSFSRHPAPEKRVSGKKQRQLLCWTHSDFNLDAGKEPAANASFYVDNRQVRRAGEPGTEGTAAP